MFIKSINYMIEHGHAATNEKQSYKWRDASFLLLMLDVQPLKGGDPSRRASTPVAGKKNIGIFWMIDTESKKPTNLLR